ncbi:MAG: chemotaxis protein CheD [Candidatus Acidiferrales bacterium]
MKKEPELQQIYLHPGVLYASPEPANLSIIVGSCVAVCIYDERLSIGGATHYLLPTLEGQGMPSPRYGDVAIAELLAGLVRAGSKKRNLQAHIYGGACVLRAFRSGTRELISDQNVRLALEILAREGIPVVRQETGGEKGRKITMRTDTGVVSFKVI